MRKNEQVSPSSLPRNVCKSIAAHIRGAVINAIIPHINTWKSELVRPSSMGGDVGSAPALILVFILKC